MNIISTSLWKDHTTPLFFLLASVLPLHAQILPITNYTPRDGLPISSTYAILQDRQGFLWFGTYAGLSKFDGFQFTNYTMDDGLADNWVRALGEDSAGRLWISTAGGITLYDGLQFTALSADSSFELRTVKDIVRDDTGNMWLGSDTGLYRYDGAHLVYFTTREGLPHDSVLTILVDRTGGVWIGTPNGIGRYSNKDLHNFTADSGLGHTVVNAIEEDTYGHLWFGTNEGVQRFDGVRFTTYTTSEGLAGNRVQAMECDRNGTLWCGTAQGLSRFDGQGFSSYTKDHGLPDSNIISINADREGNLWLIAEDKSISKLSGSGLAYFFTKGSRLSVNEIASITEDADGRIWFAIKSGLVRYDNNECTLLNPADEGLDTPNVRVVTQDRTGRVWIGTDRGVSRYDATQHRFNNFPFPDSNMLVNALYWDSQECLWLGTSSGIYTFRDGEYSRYTGSGTVSNDPICAILEDRTGTLWFGSMHHGIVTVDGGQTRTYTVEDGLAHNTVWSFFEDATGGIWISTRGGLSRFVRLAELGASRGQQGLAQQTGYRFTNYTMKNGLSGNDCRFAVTDQQYLYVGTSNGICRFNPMTGTATTFLSYFHAYQNSFFKDSAGNLWFGSRRDGAIRFSPQSQRLPWTAPRIYMTDVDLYDQPVPTEASRRFSHRDNYFSFKYVGLWFTAPETIRYRYRLLGIDDTWMTTEQRTVSYSYLPPGSYQFQVEAENNAGILSERPAVWAFTIVPPFWKAWWFRITLLLAVCTAVIVGHRLRTRIHKRRAEELEKLVQRRSWDLQRAKELLEDARDDLEATVKERTEHLRKTIDQLHQEVLEREKAQQHLRAVSSELVLTESRERRTLAVTLHDGIGQNLLMLKKALLENRETSGNDHTAGAGEDPLCALDAIIEETRTLLWDMSPPELYELGLEAAIAALTERMAERHRINISFWADKQPKRLEKDLQVLLFMTVRELIMNVVKHAHAASMTVSLECEDRNILLRVTDDGNGFDCPPGLNLPGVPKGFGLFSIRERLKNIDGSLDIDTATGRGTIITVRVPSQCH